MGIVFSKLEFESNQRAQRGQPFPTWQCFKEVFFNFNLRKYKDLLVKFEPITGQEGLLCARCC
jgi:hypothetical protein